MMLFKLALRNIVKSVRDYIVYFATLVLGVAVFYVFNALDSQTVMLVFSNDTLEILNIIAEAMSIVSVFVSFILGFLVVYASGFLMKRRKKEFGLYLLLGMGKTKVSAILLIETILIGIISLITGLLVGIGASQGMSIVVANMFDADMTAFHFTVSKSAITKTLVYFAVIFLVVMIFQVFAVGKNRLINLLNAGKKAQKNYGKNPIVCVIVFIIGAVLLGTAYYKVTAGFNDIDSLKGIGTEIVKGIIGNFAVFWSVSGLLVLIVKSNRKFYNKGLNCFTTKELAGRINTSVFAGGIISLLLFFTISILSCSMSTKNSMDRVLNKKTPMDVMFRMSIVDYETDKNIVEVMEDYGVDISVLKDVECVDVYNDGSINFASVTHGYGTDLYSYSEGICIPAIKISDYNKLARAYGIPEYQLDEGEYAIVADYRQSVKIYDKVFADGLSLVIEHDGETMTFEPAYDECLYGFICMSADESNNGVILFPDSVDLSFVNYIDNYMVANYATDDADERERLDEYFSIFAEGGFDDLVNAPENRYHAYVDSMTKTEIKNASIGIKMLLIFVGIYLGIIFLISSGAILSLKELSESADSKEKYRILRRIGVDEKQIRRSLFSQCGLFFGLPLVLAIIHSVFGIQTALLIMEVFGQYGLMKSIITAACIILGIYGIYFAITYYCSRRIISE